MSDARVPEISEQLRIEANWAMNGGSVKLAEILRAAADEIDKLRRNLLDARKEALDARSALTDRDTQQLMDKADDLQERLRKATT